jgi:hypothetical protein
MAWSKVVRVVGLSLVGLLASLTLVKDPFLQIFATWLTTWLVIKTNFSFQPHPLKTLAIAAAVVSTIRLSGMAMELGIGDGDLLGKLQERFIVDWGISGAPMKCGGLQEDGVVPPTHTAVCDIWSDPEQIVDQRVERVLESTKHEAREMEDFLQTSTPDKREMGKEGQAEALIV